MLPTIWILHLSAFFTLTCLPLSLAWVDYGNSGTATLTHYTLPEGFITSCGCQPNSTLYPTAAMSQMAYGSSVAFGPGCGQCFRINLLNSHTPTPPFILSAEESQDKTLIIKVTDLCPMTGDGWCSARSDQPNHGGQYINFDLSFPSRSIPSDFFPSNESFYGYKDFGAWNVSYTAVSCSEWAGYSDTTALGEADGFGPESVCCPADPYTNSSSLCQSYSDLNGIPPENSSTSPEAGISLRTSLTLCLLVFMDFVLWLL